MSKDEENTQKPTDEPKEAPAKASADAAAPKPRKIVRRSASTRDNPAFSEDAKPEGDAAAPSAEAPKAEGAAPAAAPAHRRFDARAPRQPRPAGGDARPPRGGDRGPRGGGDFRPPPARPMGARPIPGGSRAPAPEGAAGDFQAPPARPMGARPIPGGPRAPYAGDDRRPPRGDGPPRGDRPRGDGPPRGDRPPRDSRDFRDRRPRGDHAGHAAPAAPSKIEVKPIAKPAAPPPAPVKVEAKAPPAKGAARPIPVFIPLARAGQVAATNKPAPTPKEALAAKTKAHAPKPSVKPAAKVEAEATAFDAALVNVGADEAVAALVKAGDAAPALVDAWVAASNAAAIVEAMESEAAPSAARKAARRAINVLRSRGVAIPQRSHVVKVGERAEISIEATLIPPDSSGTIAISITSKDAGGRYHIGEVIIREPIGILQAGSGWLSGTQLKEGRNRALEGLGVAPVVVPVDWARARIAAAKKLNAASGQVVPLNYEGCRELFEPVPQGEPAHPLADLETSLDPARASDAVPASESLHLEPEFRAWVPDRNGLDELLQHVGERLGPQGVSDPEAVNTAMREETEAATDRFFSPEVRDIVVSRMRDAAISIRARKGDARASEVIQVARAVREAGLITSPPREIPFLVAFFRKALGILAQQGGGQLRVPVPAGGAPAAETSAE